MRFSGESLARGYRTLRMLGPGASGPESERLLEAVRARIVGCATYLGCGNDSEDIAQETLLVLHRRYGAVEDHAEVLKLATRICANLALNWRRRKASPAHTGESDERCRELLRLRLRGAKTNGARS